MAERRGDRLHYAFGLALLTIARPLAAIWRTVPRDPEET